MKTKKEVEEEFKFFLKTLLDNYNAKMSLLIDVSSSAEWACANINIEIPEVKGVSEYCQFELPKSQKNSWEDAVINL